MNPLISIIVPVYNADKYLSKCIDSIISQSYQHTEIILIDDGSVDKSLEICLNYKDKDSRISVIQNTHNGLVATRKLGVEKAQGEYCLFVDSDDWISEKLLESIVTICKERCVDIANYNMCSVQDGKIEKWKYTIPDGIFEQHYLETIYTRMIYDFKNNCPGIVQSLCSKLIKRNLLWECIKNEDERILMGEDAALVYHAMLKAKRIYVTSEVFYYYRIHNGSVCRTRDIDVFSKIYYFQHYMEKVLEKWNRKYRLYEQLQAYVMQFIAKGMEDIFSLKLQSLHHIPYHVLQNMGRKIVLYGAGKVGRSYYRQLLKFEGVEIVAWVDKQRKGKIYGCEIVAPDMLNKYTYDKIVIAVLNEDTAKEIKRQLEKYVSPENILWAKPQNNWWEKEIDIWSENDLWQI